MNIALNLPINRVSFGQVSTLILRTLFDAQKAQENKDNIFVFPIGPIDLSSQTNNTEEFNQWLTKAVDNALENYDREIPMFKLWHFSDSLQSFAKKQTLLTFYELDEPTKVELNIARNNNTLFSSRYSCESFSKAGVETKYLPLAFDSYNFHVTNPKVIGDGRITFNLCGKFEKRKHHQKIIRAWIKKFGNNPNYALQCAVFNPFFSDDQNKQVLFSALNGPKPFNVNFYPIMNENSVYNEFLNNADIILGMSGAEGFGLPEFQSIALGKHAVLLKAHSYKDWATDDMVTWVTPTAKIPAYDGVFFKKGLPFNQGNIFDFNEDEFIAACEQAIKKVERSKVNVAGTTLQAHYTKEALLKNVLASI